ncbi:hypothetical protein ATANTOWER_029646, partial [Ataeniobius toweri]|nr:hypothetical protein [Ataeniobius toweri]
SSPDELEERLRFYARQIKRLRKTSLMYSSPELMERIRQVERDYETAVRLVYCHPPLHTPCLQANAAAQPTQDSRKLILQSSPRQDSRKLVLQSSPRQDSRKPLLQSSPRQ